MRLYHPAAHGELTEEGKGLNDRPRAGCLLWWPWACLPMGPAEPDVDEDKLQATGTVECPVHKNCPRQEDLPLGQKQL